MAEELPGLDPAADPEDFAWELGLRRAFPFKTLGSSPLAPYLARRLANHDLAEMLTKTQRDCLARLASDETAERYAGNRRTGMLNILVTTKLLTWTIVPATLSWRRRRKYFRHYFLTPRGQSVLSIFKGHE